MKPIQIAGPLAIVALIGIYFLPVDPIEVFRVKVKMCGQDETCIAKVVEAF